MLIDIHVHTAEFSSCSDINMEEAIPRAKSIGLDGICITDHESNGMINKAARLARQHHFLIIVGMEILTYEGDLLVFGLKEVPPQKMYAASLIRLVSQKGGVCISAHPFRDNGRGMGEYISKLDGLAGIEVFNGNTKPNHNYQAYELGKIFNIPCFGGSDAHKLEQVGVFATAFPDGISDEKGFIGAVKEGQVYPVTYKNSVFGEVMI